MCVDQVVAPGLLGGEAVSVVAHLHMGHKSSHEGRIAGEDNSVACVPTRARGGMAEGPMLFNFSVVTNDLHLLILFTNILDMLSLAVEVAGLVCAVRDLGTGTYGQQFSETAIPPPPPPG